MRPEDFQEYRQRILGYQAGEDPLDLQARMPAKLALRLTGASRTRLGRRPRPGKWSVAEIVAHLAEDEWVGAYRIRRILALPGAPIAAFDQARWAVTGKYAQRDVTGSLELFRALRRANLALFKALTASQWRRHGVHAERGRETLADIAAYYAGHDLNHLAQIDAILAGR
jgi:hypothetical protein